LGYEAKGQTFASHTSRTSGLPYGVFNFQMISIECVDFSPVNERAVIDARLICDKTILNWKLSIQHPKAT